jgi:hypothetical protein
MIEKPMELGWFSQNIKETGRDTFGLSTGFFYKKNLIMIAKLIINWFY